MKAATIMVLAMLLIVPLIAAGSASARITAIEVDHLLYQFKFEDAVWKSNVTEIRWTFGDGASSTEMQPTHQYAQHGNYTVRCTATGNDGSTSGILQLDARAPIIDPDDSTVNVGVFSIPAGLLCVSSFAMLMLVQTDNHPAADYLGRNGKKLMILVYFTLFTIGGLLVFQSMYPGGI